MRLIGMGLLAFLLAGIALFLSRSETFQFGTHVLTEAFYGPQLRFETAHHSPKSLPGQSQVIAQRINPEDPVILTGIPAYQGVSFYLPTQARPTSGYLQLDVTMQALAGVEGVLRISIGTTRRAEMLLHPGEAGRSLRIDLTTDDLTRERLVVSLSLQGDGPQSPCSIDAGLAAIVEIETTSALFLTLDENALSDRDSANMDGRQITLPWGDDPLDRAAALAAAHYISGSSWAVGFTDEPHAIDPAKVRLAFPEPDRKPGSDFAWSNALLPSSAIFGLRRFKHSQTWRLRYDMLDAADPKLPATFSLSMLLGPLQLDAAWQISVTLNGRLVDQVLLAPGTTTVTRTIDLSSARHTRENVIEIVTSSTADTVGDCNEGPDLIAEITDETKLIPGNKSFHDPLLSLRHTLSQKAGWHLTVDNSLTAPEAVISASLLSMLFPSDTQPTKAERSAVVYVLARGATLLHWHTQRASDVWLVSFDDEGRTWARRLSDDPMPETRAVTLLVDLSGMAT